MTEDQQITNQEPNHEDESISSSWAVSICFWCTLLLAACVYASVALAPKFFVWSGVRHEYQTNVQQLVALEQEVDYLERVKHALKTDPEFVDRLVGVSRPQADNEELIPVSGSLLFGRGEEQSAINKRTPVSYPPFHRLTTLLASNTKWRTCLLTFSACLTIFAFTFLNDAGGGLVHSTGAMIKRAALMPVRRYFASDTAVSSDDEVGAPQHIKGVDCT